MATDELDAMLVRNLDQVRLAYDRVVYAVQPQVEKAINETFEAAFNQLGWDGGSAWDDEGLWTAPPEWIVDADTEPTYLAKAWFDSDGQEGDEILGADHLWLVTLCGRGRGRYGLKLSWESGLGVHKRDWRKAIGLHSAVVQRLVGMGFVQDESDMFFRSVECDTELLATAIETNDYGSFVSPIKAAVSELPAAIAVFSEIIAAARRPG